MTDTRPNILIITTDSQRFDTVGSHAPDFVRTPHYDFLRREGIEFTSCYSDCPLCVPARTSIMTGKYASSHTMTNNGLTSDVMGMTNTLPSYLYNLGYQTAAIGKMHFGPMRSRHGFNEMIMLEDYYEEMKSNGNPLNPMRHGLGQCEVYPGMATVPESMTLTSWTAEKCVDYINRRRDPQVPFLLWCSFSKPHEPLDPPEPYYSMYRNSDIPDPVYGDWCKGDKFPEAMKRYSQMISIDLVPNDIIREARAAYYGLVTQIDYNMGRIISALQDIEILDNTLIIFASDHGNYLGDHGALHCFFFHEPAAHVPFLMRLPKTWSNRCNGDTVTSVITHADILPTLISAAGGKIPDDTDGQDLISLARGELSEPRKYLESICESDLQEAESIESYGITDGKWKYIWFPEGGIEHFFNLADDPNELVNLAETNNNISKLNELRQELINRHISRNSEAVKDGKLVITPIRKLIEKDRRSKSWPGFGTESSYCDVRH